MSAAKTRTKTTDKKSPARKGAPADGPAPTARGLLLADPDAVAVVQGFFEAHTQGIQYEVRDREYGTARASLAGMLLMLEGLQALAAAEGIETT